MKITLMNGNVLDMLKKIPDESVDCVVTSPPYYGLRSYKGADTIWGGNPECEHEWVSQKVYQDNLRFRDPNHVAQVGNNKNPEIFDNPSTKADLCSKCGAWKGQLGLEPTYNLYVEHLMLVMDEIKRVLKKTGTVFWNMGDSYSSKGGMSNPEHLINAKVGNTKSGEQKGIRYINSLINDIPDKSLMMIPERFAMSAIDNGWILRNKIIWYKRNGMPSSVKDRLSNKWEYIFFLTKSKKYYYDLDSIRKKLSVASIKDKERTILNKYKGKYSKITEEESEMYNSPRARNMRKNRQLSFTSEELAIIYKNMFVGQDELYLPPTEKQLKKFYKDLHSKQINAQDMGNSGYDSKYSKDSYGQTLQGFTRENSIEKVRKQSYIDAKKLFPDDINTQKEYIKNIHDHYSDVKGANPGDVMYDSKYLSDRDVKTASPAGRVMRNLADGKTQTLIREAIGNVNQYLKNKLRESNLSIYNLSALSNQPETTIAHYFRTDESGAALPSREFWDSVKDKLGLGNYDDFVKEEYKSVMLSFNEHGANPGDVISQPAVRSKSWYSNAGHPFTHERKYDPNADGGDFLDIPTRPHKFAHFAVYPETLIESLIKSGCPKDGVVLDPFAGSGTTGLVARNLGRSSILIEISSEYCNIIKDRLNWGAGIDIEYEVNS